MGTEWAESDDTNVFKNHEMINKKDSFALEQLPDGLQSLSLILAHHATGRVRQQVHPVNVLQITERKLHVWPIAITN